MESGAQLDIQLGGGGAQRPIIAPPLNISGGGRKMWILLNHEKTTLPIQDIFVKMFIFWSKFV